jgi:hypothetical protein
MFKHRFSMMRLLTRVTFANSAKAGWSRHLDRITNNNKEAAIVGGVPEVGM